MRQARGERKEADLRPVGGPRIRLGVAALLLFALGSAVLLVAAQAGADQTLGSGQVTRLYATPGSLRAPVDGRLNGYAFKATVKGIGFAPAAGTPGERVTAAPGAELVLVQVEETSTDFTQVGWLDLSKVDGSPPTETLLVGATRIPLEASAPGDTFAVGIPKGSAVSLEMARAGFAQTMDLRAAKRVGPSPTALYRDPSEATVTVASSVTQTLAATTSPGGAPVSFEVTLTGAAVSFFGPAGTELPDANGAYLMVSLRALAGGSGLRPVAPIDTTANLPASALRLVLPDGTRAAARHQRSELDSEALLGGIYVFAVPATLTHAQVVIDPGANVAGRQLTTTSPTPVILAFAQPATFDINLPAPGSASRPTPPTIPAASVRRHRRWNTGAIAALLALLAAAGAAGVGVVRRRGHGLAPHPILHTRAALLAGVPPLGIGGRPSPRGLPQPEPAIIDVRATPLQLPGGQQPPSATRLVVLILGPLQVEGLVAPIRRRPVTRMLVYLALNLARPVSSDELRYALATSDEVEPTEAALYVYASYLRGALPESLLPASGAGGYQLGAGVESDWALFEELAARAAANPSDKAPLLAAGLALVRGQPLAHQSWTGIDQHVHRMVAAIESVAHQAAEDALETGQPRDAETAVAQGLLACPASPLLWEDRLVAAAAGSGYGLERAWTTAQHTLGPDALLIEAAYRRLAHQQV